jgi:hypothetical protein
VGFTTPLIRGDEPKGASTSSGCPGNTDVKFPAGTTSITIPPYDVLRITVSGGGGAGGLSNPDNRAGDLPPGADGQPSSIPSLGMTGNGGKGGRGHRNAFFDAYCLYNGSGDYDALGGTGAGGQYTATVSDTGSGKPSGPVSTDPHADSYWPKSGIGGEGAAGGGGLNIFCGGNTAAALGANKYFNIGAGGDGGVSIKVWTRGEAGAPVPGSSIAVSIGKGGVGVNGAAPAPGGQQPGGYTGDDGYIRVETTCSQTAKFTEVFSPGSYQFVVPDYTTLKVTMAGGGGGGANQYFMEPLVYPGKPGGNSTFLGLTALGGIAGNCPPALPFQDNPSPSQPPPLPAGASGGDINSIGGGSKGGGGTGFTEYEGVPNVLTNAYHAGDGGTAGRVVKQWNRSDAGAPQPGQVIPLVIGAGGAGGWRDQAKSANNKKLVDDSNRGNPGGLYLTYDVFAKIGAGFDGYDGYGIIEGTMVARPPSPTETTTQNTTAFVFKVGLDKASTSPVTVSYRTEGGVAGASGSNTSFNKEYTPGTYQYTIPPYDVLNVEVGAAGGGSGSIRVDYPAINAGPGRPGGNSSFLSLSAIGGVGGDQNTGATPAGGAATGGDVNTPGGGGRGGIGQTNLSYVDNQYQGSQKTGIGAAGGKAYKTWRSTDAGAPAAGTSVTVTVGAAGLCQGYESYQASGTDYGQAFLNGADGFVRISGTKSTLGSTGSGNGLTATPDVDYISTSGTLTFAPGETYKEITVQVLYDTVIEPDESFAVILSSPIGATIDVGTATGTINGSVATAPPGIPPPPPPPPPPPDVPGQWLPYYVPRTDLPGAGFFWGMMYWSWSPTATHPTADIPLPMWGSVPYAPIVAGSTRQYTQGEFGASTGDNVNWPALQGKMSIGGDPYQDPSQEIFMLPYY